MVQGGGAAAAGVCTGLSNPTLPAAQITSTCGLRVSGNFQCSGWYELIPSTGTHALLLPQCSVTSIAVDTVCHSTI